MNKLTKTIVAATAITTIAFGANAYAKRDGGHNGNRMISKVTQRLNLDDAQAEALKTLQAELLETRTLMKGDGTSMKEQFSQLISADSFDQGAALSLINERAAAFQANAPELVAAAGTFFDSLNAEQKAEVQKLMERGGKHHGRRGNHGDE